ncbi:hypothetical protein [Rhodococcus pyridinivorans]|uniref:hypothetical protein n=1 Tax=Rhodococcus pyridinivorans TaxID=103816 RepID=UPI003AB043C2
MTEPTVRHQISIKDATRLDPAQIAPPIVVTDGEHTEIGAAHGRVLPLIGHRRPYIYDVSLPDKRRVYAYTVLTGSRRNLRPTRTEIRLERVHGTVHASLLPDDVRPWPAADIRTGT